MNKKELILSRVRRYGRDSIRMEFRYSSRLIAMVKAIPGRQFDGKDKSWYVPFSKENVELIREQFSPLVRIISTGLLIEAPSKEDDGLTHSNRKMEITRRLKRRLSTEISEKLDSFRIFMVQRRYSEKSINTYINQLEVFFSYYADRDIEQIDNEDLVRFNHNHILVNGFSVSYQSQMINAIKLFYSQIVKKQLNPEGIIRPQKEKRLPIVLSMEEVARILNAIRNMKHKTVISTIYSAGLRLGESLNLEVNDIDFERKTMHIRGAKGNKDRYIPLSSNLQMMLSIYFEKYRPKRYVFEGAGGGKYSSTSVKNIISRAVHAAGIKKRVTAHTFRHSYATHLLESGTDLRYIQEMLGHASSRTTEIYTHVSRRSLGNIKSPFDSFNF